LEIAIPKTQGGEGDDAAHRTGALTAPWFLAWNTKNIYRFPFPFGTAANERALSKLACPPPALMLGWLWPPRRLL